MKQQFQIGQTVRLKSDGPLMTVNFIDESNNQIQCVWFENGSKKMDTFHPDTIEPDDDTVDIGEF